MDAMDQTISRPEVHPHRDTVRQFAVLELYDEPSTSDSTGSRKSAGHLDSRRKCREVERHWERKFEFSTRSWCSESKLRDVVICFNETSETVKEYPLSSVVWLRSELRNRCEELVVVNGDTWAMRDQLRPKGEVNTRSLLRVALAVL